MTRPTSRFSRGPLVAICHKCGKAFGNLDSHSEDDCADYLLGRTAEDGRRGVD